MSVLRHDTYANETQPLFAPFGTGETTIQPQNNNPGPVSKTLSSGSTRIFQFTIPPEYVGKACLFNFSGSLANITMATGTVLSAVVQMGCQSTMPGSTNYGVYVGTPVNTTNVAITQNYNISLVATPNATQAGAVFLTLNSGAPGITAVTCYCNSASVTLLDTAPAFNSSLVISV